MKLAVLTYSNAANPLGFPVEYPAEIREVDDNAVISPPWVEMTAEELDALRQQYGPQVQAIAADNESLPVEVELWKFRAALRMAGLFEPVKTAIAALPEAKRIVVEEKMHAKETINRLDPTVVALAAALGIPRAQVDQVFRTAAGLS